MDKFIEVGDPLTGRTIRMTRNRVLKARVAATCFVALFVLCLLVAGYALSGLLS